MSLRAYLTTMILATVGSALCLTAVVLLISPDQNNVLGMALFYTAMFLTVMGTASILGFVVRFVLLKKRLVAHVVIISFRQAFLIAFLTVTVLILLSQRLFSWLNMGFLIVGFTTLEFLLISFSTTNNE
jgi:hypothetical protein